MTRRSILALAFVALAAGRSIAAAPLDVAVKDVRASASTVRTTIQLRDVVPDRFKRVIERGGQLHLRVQAELWEKRPVWDRLVYPAIVRMFRLGGTPPSAAVANPMEVTVDLGGRDRLASAEEYYVHVVATVGTLAEREADDVGDAVFGSEGDASGLGSLGRMVFRTALKVSDYLQSVSADVKSRKLPGSEIIRP
jgi:hypothetical protein